MLEFAPLVDVSSARKRRRCAFAVAKLITHQFAVVVQLNRKPIPALLIFGRRPRAEFAVHPRRTRKMLRRAVPDKIAFHFHPRVTEISRSFAFVLKRNAVAASAV